MMLEAAANHPLIAAMQRQDGDLLGMLADHPRSVALHQTLGPSAVIGAVLPVWRRHGLARTDWDLADQGFALHGLITGMAMSVVEPGAGPRPTADPLEVLADAVTALLGPEHADRRQIASTAAEVIEFLRAGRATALRLIG